jgi:site-specific recombinase XerD
VEQFLRSRRRAGYTSHVSARGLAPLLGYLRRLQIVPEMPPPIAETAVDRLLERYADYLRRERGLVPPTIGRCQDIARRFLTTCVDGEKLDLDRLTAADVTSFILGTCCSHSVGTAKVRVSDLRSLLRFLYCSGETPTPLAAAVPSVAGWRLCSLPHALEPEQVTKLLDNCDRDTAIGQRDYAILLLLVRLGLRAGEVIAIELGDIDWKQGEIKIRGKGHRHERLPLPVDVGEALVTYLREGRPRVATRRLFVRNRAPRRPLSRVAITHLVFRACVRAQIPRVGPHRLRHTAATHMLRQGSSLPEIAQVLRHRNLQTTAIYAKVDRTALRELAQPWPGGRR